MTTHKTLPKFDDFGLTPIEEAHKQDLFEIMEERYGTGSTIIAGQLPVKHWHEYLGGGMFEGWNM